MANRQLVGTFGGVVIAWAALLAQGAAAKPAAPAARKLDANLKKDGEKNRCL